MRKRDVEYASAVYLFMCTYKYLRRTRNIQKTNESNEPNDTDNQLDETNHQPDETDYQPVQRGLQKVKRSYQPDDIDNQLNETNYQPVKRRLQKVKQSHQPDEIKNQPVRRKLQKVKRSHQPDETDDQLNETNYHPVKRTLEKIKRSHQPNETDDQLNDSEDELNKTGHQPVQRSLHKAKRSHESDETDYQPIERRRQPVKRRVQPSLKTIKPVLKPRKDPPHSYTSKIQIPEKHVGRTKVSMTIAFSKLFHEPSGSSQGFCRMSAQDFELLLQLTGLNILKDSHMRNGIPPKLRLAIALRYLSTGESYRTLGNRFRVSSQFLSGMVPVVCAAINKGLEDHMKMPTTAEDWLQIEKGFRNNFPHCVGVVTEKKFSVKPRREPRSRAYNINVMASIDSKHCFTFANVKATNSYKATKHFHDVINTSLLNLPKPDVVPGFPGQLPYAFVSDGTVNPDKNILTRFPQKTDETNDQTIYNDRCDAVSCVAKNTFAILTSAFKFLDTSIPIHFSDRTKDFTLSCMLLHNFLMRSETSRSLYHDDEMLDVCEDGRLVRNGTWRTKKSHLKLIKDVKPMPVKPSDEALQTRLEFVDHFISNNS